MTVWVTRLHVAVLGLKGAVRGHWKRIAVGALCGWLLASVIGAFAVVGFESAHLITAEDSTLLGAALVWMGMGVGAMVAYVARPQPVERRTSDR
ncbi:MAG TPA: hypothetical protein VFR38_12880 [Gaiellaceae bacterium]|nr:hypothetical protein [Gaiellaceae bacterium]